MSAQMHDFDEIDQFLSSQALYDLNEFEDLQNQPTTNAGLSSPPELVPDNPGIWDTTAPQFDQPITPVFSNRGPRSSTLKSTGGGPHFAINDNVTMSQLENYNHINTTTPQYTKALMQSTNTSFQPELPDTSQFGIYDYPTDYVAQIGSAITMPPSTNELGQGNETSMVVDGENLQEMVNQRYRQLVNQPAEQAVYNNQGMMTMPTQQQYYSTTQPFPTTVSSQSNNSQYNTANRVVKQPSTPHMYQNQMTMQARPMGPQSGHQLTQGAPMMNQRYHDGGWANQVLSNPQEWAQHSQFMRSNQQPQTPNQFRQTMANQRAPQYASNMIQKNGYPVQTPQSNMQNTGASQRRFLSNTPVSMYSPASNQAQPVNRQPIPQQAKYQNFYNMNTNLMSVQNNNMMAPNAFMGQSNGMWPQNGNIAFPNILEQQADIVNANLGNTGYFDNFANATSKNMYSMPQIANNDPQVTYPIQNNTAQSWVSPKPSPLPTYTTGLPGKPMNSFDQNNLRSRNQNFEQWLQNQKHLNAQVLTNQKANTPTIQGRTRPQEHGSVEPTAAMKSQSRVSAKRSLQMPSKSNSNSDTFTTLTKMDLKRDFMFDEERRSTGIANTMAQKNLSGLSLSRESSIPEFRPPITESTKSNVGQERSKVAQPSHGQSAKRKRSKIDAEQHESVKSNTKKQKTMTTAQNSPYSSNMSPKLANTYHNDTANSVMAELNNFGNEGSQDGRIRPAPYTPHGVNKQKPGVMNQPLVNMQPNVALATKTSEVSASNLPDSGNVDPQSSSVQAVYEPFMVEPSELKTAEDRRAATYRVLRDAFAANPTCMPSTTYQRSRSRSTKSADVPEGYRDASQSRSQSQSQPSADATAYQPSNVVNAPVTKPDPTPDKSGLGHYDGSYDPGQAILDDLVNFPRSSPSDHQQPDPAPATEAEKWIEASTAGGARVYINPSMETTPEPMRSYLTYGDGNGNGTGTGTGTANNEIDDRVAIDDTDFTDLLNSDLLDLDDRPAKTTLEVFDAGDGKYQYITRWGTDGDEFKSDE